MCGNSCVSVTILQVFSNKCHKALILVKSQVRIIGIAFLFVCCQRIVVAFFLFDYSITVVEKNGILISF